MDHSQALEPYPQAPVIVEPANCALNNPAGLAQQVPTLAANGCDRLDQGADNFLLSCKTSGRLSFGVEKQIKRCPQHFP